MLEVAGGLMFHRSGAIACSGHLPETYVHSKVSSPPGQCLLGSIPPPSQSAQATAAAIALMTKVYVRESETNGQKAARCVLTCLRALPSVREHCCTDETLVLRGEPGDYQCVNGNGRRL